MSVTQIPRFTTLAMVALMFAGVPLPPAVAWGDPGHKIIVRTVGRLVLATDPGRTPVRPDNVLTPGKVASTDPNDVCGVIGGLTNSRRHRHTPIELKREVYAAYGISNDGRPYEVDHRVPLCLGGGDVPKNRWPQQGFEHPGYHDKDRLEERVCIMVCRDRSMSLTDGQAIFLGDWIAGYQQGFGQSPE